MSDGGVRASNWRPASQWTPSGEDVIDVWRLDLAVTEQDWSLLAPDEVERARRIVVERKRDQRASSRAHLRRILSLYVNVDPESLQFEYGEHGKPGLAEGPDDPTERRSPARQRNPTFNLSHSQTVGLVGVTRDSRIGIDVEHAREVRDFSGLAQRFFSADESVALQGLPDAERPAAFYRAWTRKEAYVKALGTGLSFPSDGFTIEYTSDGPGRIVTTDMPGDDPSVWRFADVDLGVGFAGAICFEGPDRPIRWWEIRVP